MVTGATGILGIRIVHDLLLRGETVRAMRRSNSDMAFVEKTLNFYGSGKTAQASIEWVEGDLIDTFTIESAVEGIQTIYHCAALVSYKKSDAKRLIKINEEGTANLVNAALLANVKNLCHVSSVAALGVSKTGPTNENTVWSLENSTNYGLSKFLAEREAWRGSAEGLNVSVVNPSVILGPSKMDQSSGMFVDFLMKGSSFYPRGSVGMVDVKDVSEACIRSVELGKFNERFVLNAESLPYKSLLEIAARIFGNGSPKYPVPELVLEIVWRFLGVIRFFGFPINGITKETARSVSRVSSYSSQKALANLAIEFRSVKESLNDIRRFHGIN